MNGVDLEHCWCSYHEAVEVFRVSGDTLRKLVDRGELRKLKRKPKNKQKAPFVYYNVADLVEYRKHSKTCKGFDLNDIEYSVFADREKYVDTMTLNEYAEMKGVHRQTIQTRLYNLIYYNMLSSEDIRVPGTKAVCISDYTKYALDNWKGMMNAAGKRTNVSAEDIEAGHDKPIYKTKCTSCQYYCRGSLSCDYILVEEHSRGCDWGDACAKYKRGRKKREKVDLRLKGSL